MQEVNICTVIRINSMPNKTKLIKLLIFSIVIFTLLINLAGLGYVEYCREYSAYNNEITSTFNKGKNQETKIEDYREACLKLKPDLLIPTYNTLGYWSCLMILVSIVIMIVIKIDSKIFKRKMFSKKEKYILIGAILVSLMISFEISLIELDFYYFGWDCPQFLL